MVELDRSVPAVLLKTDPNPMHHGTLGLVRSLGRRGVAVHGVHEHRWTPAARSRHLAGCWVWRPDPGDVEAVLAGLGRIAATLDGPAVLYPTDDAGALLLAEHGDPLRDRFLFPRPPADLPRRMADKAALPELCAEFGMACPRTERAVHPDQVYGFDLPLVVKRITPWAGGVAGTVRPSTSLVRDVAGLDALAAEVADAPGTLLLQEHLGDGATERPSDWFVHAYLDPTSRMLFGGVGVKERSYPAYAGLTGLGRVEEWEQLRRDVATFLGRAGFAGIVDLDLRVDPRDGRPKLLDANPRLGAQFRMFRNGDGVDVGLAQHLDLTGRPVPGGRPERRRFVVEPYDPVAALSYLRRGDLGLRDWAASYRGVDEPAWFARDDLLPFALMAARTVTRTVTRAVGRAASTPPVPAVRGTDPRSSDSPSSDSPSSDSRSTGSRAADRRATAMQDHTDVVIIGAGPYGLSVGAHLAGSGLRVRHFGGVMAAWKAMPKGMFLKSQGFASNIADPDHTHTLEAYCRRTETPYAPYGLPVELDTFVAYGEWFARERVPGVEDRRVTGVSRDGDGFRVDLADGGRVVARRVVVAIGLTDCAVMPPELADLPADLVSHAEAWADFTPLSGRRVVVVGAGQSALQSAALAHEAGAEAQVVARGDQIRWNGDPLPEQRSLWRRFREPEAPLGSGWATWFYSNRPDLYRRLPATVRLSRARSALGPAGAHWLRSRVDEIVPILTGHRIEAAAVEGDEVRLDLRDAEGGQRVLHADHVIAGTGYRTDLVRMGFLAPELRASLATLGGTPAVAADYRSSVPGLYFCGPIVTPSLGPVMRFAYGSAHAAPTVVRSLTTALAAPSPVAARA